MAAQTSIEKLFFSGSTNGMPIKVAATATLGTTIHTAVTGTAALDEIWLWAVNTSSAAVKLTIEYGDATAPDHNIEATIPPEAGAVLMIPGWVLNNAKVITAFAGTANVVLVNGVVNRLS